MATRPGRPAGSPPNREAILAVARQEFAARGYDGATIRGIAAGAGVDPALVHHYFGSKDQLFAATIDLPFTPTVIVDQVLTGDAGGLGERLLRMVLGAWEGGPPNAGAGLVALLRSAVSNDEAARMVKEFLTREVLGRIAEGIGAPQPRLRAALCGSQVIGLVLARYVVRVEPLASADPETLIGCYAPTLQRYLTEPLPGD